MDPVPAYPRYDRWEEVPPHLKTRTTLNRLGLRPARGQQPAAVIQRTFRRETWAYALYDVGQAVPKRTPTEAQRVVLAAGQRLAGRKRLYGHCGMCDDDDVPRDILARYGQCLACQEADEAAVRAEDRAKAVHWARSTLADPQAIIIDTETTDLDGEIIEIAIMTMQGEVLLDTFIHPLADISPGAQAVHGLTRLDLQDAPTFVHIYAQVGALLTPATRIVAYNAGFDMAALHRTCTQYGLASLRDQTEARWACAMVWYAQWFGEWSAHHGDYRFQPLGGGHRAREDCEAVLRRLRAMAGPPDGPPHEQT